jgi:hypothetical protein
MADSCNGNEKRERQTAAVKDLEEYIRDPHNLLNEFVKTITRKVQCCKEAEQVYFSEIILLLTYDSEQ